MCLFTRNYAGGHEYGEVNGPDIIKDSAKYFLSFILSFCINSQAIIFGNWVLGTLPLLLGIVVDRDSVVAWMVQGVNIFEVFGGCSQA